MAGYCRTFCATFSPPETLATKPSGAHDPRLMVFDSLCAFLLFGASVGAWCLTSAARAATRGNLRFAAMLFAALAAARALGLALPQLWALPPAVAMIAASLGGTLILLALFAMLARPLPAGLSAAALILALGLGLAASLSGEPAYEAVCQLAGAILVLGAGLNGVAAAALPLITSLSLLCGGFALMDGAISPAEIFFAGALIGAASQTRVEAQGQEAHRPAIKVGG